MSSGLAVGFQVYDGLDGPSGGFLYDRRLADSFREAGHELRVLAMPWRSYPLCLAQNLSREGSARAAGLRPPDLLIQDELNHPSLFLANRRIRKKSRAPVAAVVHHLRCLEPHRRLAPLYRRVEREYLKSVDAMVANSRHTLESVADLLGGRLPPHVVAHPGGDRLLDEIPAPDPDQVRERAAEPGPLKLLYVGSISRRKGLVPLLRAMEGLHPGSVRLNVVGSGESDPAYARKARRMARANGLAGVVRFAGRREAPELARIMAASHVMCMPFAFEGFGIAYLEGFSFSLPALAPRGSGSAEIIDHGVNGFLVAPDDVKGVRELIRALAVDRAELARMSLDARRRFEDFPSWAESAARARDFLVGLTGGLSEPSGERP